jgi:hypothetical protein
MRSMLFHGALVALVVAAPLPPSAVGESPRLLRDFLSSTAGLTDSALASLAGGGAISGSLEPAAPHEIAVYAAVRVLAPARRVAERVADATRVKTGPAILAIGKFGAAPTLDDVKAVRLLQPDMDALARCARGRCDSKLASLAPEVFRRFDWTSPDARARAEDAVRAGVVRYASDYLARGNEALMDYRDVRHPTSLAREFHQLVEASPYLREHAPELQHYLLTYPRASLAGAESYLYWASETFGLKPVLSVYHVVSYPHRDHTVVVSKQIFASRYFDTSLEITAVSRDPDSHTPEASYLLYVARARVDSLRGFWGHFKRRTIEREAREAAARVVEATRRACTRTP